MVFTETLFTNWKNQHNQGSLFASRQVTVSDVDVPLRESGTYYVMLSNVFSALTRPTHDTISACNWRMSAFWPRSSRRELLDTLKLRALNAAPD